MKVTRKEKRNHLEQFHLTAELVKEGQNLYSLQTCPSVVKTLLRWWKQEGGAGKLKTKGESRTGHGRKTCTNTGIIQEHKA